MNEVRKVVFHSARQEDARQKFLEKQSRRAEFSKYLSIMMSIILLLILFAAFAVLLGLWQAPGPTLVSAL
jgi:nitrogen fixation/metabolism regulation signal transduction histidine kinase